MTIVTLFLSDETVREAKEIAKREGHGDYKRLFLVWIYRGLIEDREQHREDLIRVMTKPRKEVKYKEPADNYLILK